MHAARPYDGPHTWLRGEWHMGLSVKTLFLTNVAVLFLSAATAWYFWRLYRESAVLLWWSFGTAVAGLA